MDQDSRGTNVYTHSWVDLYVHAQQNIYLLSEGADIHLDQHHDHDENADLYPHPFRHPDLHQDAGDAVYLHRDQDTIALLYAAGIVKRRERGRR